MKNLKILSLIFGALILVWLDISFFPIFEYHGVSVLTSLIILINGAIFFKRREDLILLCLFSSVFLSIFSSLPIIQILIGFIGIPLLVRFFREKFFPETSFLFASFYLIFSTSMFFFGQMITSWDFGAVSFKLLPIFTTLNSIFGLAIYFVLRKLHLINSRSEIKI